MVVPNFLKKGAKLRNASVCRRLSDLRMAPRPPLPCPQALLTSSASAPLQVPLALTPALCDPQLMRLEPMKGEGRVGRDISGAMI